MSHRGYTIIPGTPICKGSIRQGLHYLYQYPQFVDAFLLLVSYQHHRYLIHYWSQSRQQRRSQIHTTTHVLQAAITYLCSIRLYSMQRQITPTTTHPNLISASLTAKVLSTQRSANYIVNGVSWCMTITLTQTQWFFGVWMINGITESIQKRFLCTIVYQRIQERRGSLSKEDV